MRRALIAAFLLGLAMTAAAARAQEALSLEGKIALPGVAGRIDHMAVDLARNRLLVAALGNGTLEIVDLAGGSRVKQVVGLHEPQGVGYALKPDLVVVASAGDGTVRFFHGEDLAPAGSLALSSDADNVRIDPGTGKIIVGFGSGGLAVIDPEKKSKIGDIKLAAHPEIVSARPRLRPGFRQRAGCRPNRRYRLRDGKADSQLDGPRSAGKFPARDRRFGNDDRRGLPPSGKARLARYQDRCCDAAAGHVR